MPGILYHLTFAEEVYKNLEKNIKIDQISFLSGNLIPDLAVDKHHSHYRDNASTKGFFVPNMSLAKKDLFIVKDPIKLGMYCHLYLDYHYIKDFLIPEFVWDTENNMVINPRNNKKWNVGAFFSPLGMYGSYTEINRLILKDGLVSLENMLKIPEFLPNTGIDIFDNRREKTWRTELEEYLSERKEYTGDIFDYDRLTNFIKSLAIKFSKEILED